jgi:hypothetical protein
MVLRTIRGRRSTKRLRTGHEGKRMHNSIRQISTDRHAMRCDVMVALYSRGYSGKLYLLFLYDLVDVLDRREFIVD